MVTATPTRSSNRSGTRSNVPGVNVTNNADLRGKLARVAELKHIERQGAAAERERKEIEADLQATLAAANQTQFVLRGTVVAKLSSQRHAQLYDYKLLQSTYPEAYAAIHSEKPYRYLQVL